MVRKLTETGTFLCQNGPSNTAAPGGPWVRVVYRMRYVCEYCGQFLKVDKQIDFDAVIQAVIADHLARACPHRFAGEDLYQKAGR